MAPVHSRPTNDRNGNEATTRPINIPPIPYSRKIHANQKDNSKDSYVTVEIRINPPIEDSAVFSKKVRILSDGTAEDWIRWLMIWSEVVRSKPLANGNAKVRMALILLGGKAKETFQSKFVELAQDEFHDVDVSFMSSLEELGKKFLPLKAAAKQKAYLRYHLRMGNQGENPSLQGSGN